MLKSLRYTTPHASESVKVLGLCGYRAEFKDRTGRKGRRKGGRFEGANHGGVLGRKKDALG